MRSHRFMAELCRRLIVGKYIYLLALPHLSGVIFTPDCAVLGIGISC